MSMVKHLDRLFLGGVRCSCMPKIHIWIRVMVTKTSVLYWIHPNTNLIGNCTDLRDKTI